MEESAEDGEIMEAEERGRQIKHPQGKPKQREAGNSGREEQLEQEETLPRPVEQQKQTVEDLLEYNSEEEEITNKEKIGEREANMASPAEEPEVGEGSEEENEGDQMEPILQ